MTTGPLPMGDHPCSHKATALETLRVFNDTPRLVKMPLLRTSMVLNHEYPVSYKKSEATGQCKHLVLVNGKSVHLRAKISAQPILQRDCTLPDCEYFSQNPIVL